MLCFFHQEFYIWTRIKYFWVESNRVLFQTYMSWFYFNKVQIFKFHPIKYFFSDPSSILSNSLKFVFIFREDPTPTSEIG